MRNEQLRIEQRSWNKERSLKTNHNGSKRTIPFLLAGSCLLFISAIIFTNCSLLGDDIETLRKKARGEETLVEKVEWDGPVRALWARTTLAGSGAMFRAVVVDGDGNVYIAGIQEGTETYDYGDGVTATGTGTSFNPLLVKYNSSGTALWARTITSGSYAEFPAIAVDSAGNVYAAGNQSGTEAYDYGDGVTATGTGTSYNPLLVKYNSSGAALWARTIEAGFSASFGELAVDSAGNVYTAGYQSSGTYDYGDGVTATGTSTIGNPVLVKYNSSGTALWASTIISGTYADFYAVAVDSAGNIYAAGSQSGTEAYDYGDGVNATGTGTVSNPVLVKYNSSGTAQWARTTLAGSGGAYFSAVAADSAGNVYAAGTQIGAEAHNYGDGVTLTGTSIGNPILVKYNSSGTTQWGRTIIEGSSGVSFYDVDIDNAGNVYTVGVQNGAGVLDYGDGVTVTGTGIGLKPALVKYNSSGTALWARTIISGLSADFKAVAVDNNGNVYASGNQNGTETYDYGDGVTATGAGSNNPVLVKYGN